MEQLIAFNAALALAESLLPIIDNLAARGEISVEKQAEARQRYLSLRAKADGQFTGPQWQVAELPPPAP